MKNQGKSKNRNNRASAGQKKSNGTTVLQRKNNGAAKLRKRTASKVRADRPDDPKSNAPSSGARADRQEKPQNRTASSKLRADRPGPMLYPVPAVMVTCGDMETSNIITIGWTGIINTDPPMTYVSVRKSRFSHGMIAARKEFVINLVTEELARAADYCGVRSGSKVDKFREMDLHKVPADIVAAPLIAESPVNLECKVFDVKELPSHDMFMAEIVAVHIDEDLVDEKGAYHFDYLDLISYNHGHYYKVSRKPTGRFGFSVMKPKTRKRINREAHERNKTRKAHKKLR